MHRRVVVTGAGWVTPLGCGLDEVWNRLLAGQSGIGPITHFDARDFPVRIAAEVPRWPPEGATISPSEQNVPRQTQYAVFAAREAMRAAGLDGNSRRPQRCGVCLGCGETFPELKHLGSAIAAATDDGPFHAGKFFDQVRANWNGTRPASHEPDLACRLIAAEHALQGMNVNIIAGCVSSTQAIGHAAAAIADGTADVVLTGGAHSMIHPVGMTGLYRLGVLSSSNERQSAAMRPFDRLRDGFVAGESGGVLVLESLEHARRRKAEIWAELTGFASTHDAFRMTDIRPDGQGLIACIGGALKQAGLSGEQIDYINAHGTSTPLNDRVETLAVKQAFGEAMNGIPISSTKSMLGHSTTACGAVEAIVLLMVLRSGMLPPTANYQSPDPECDLDYVPNQARERSCRHVLNNNMGLGGQNAVLVLSRYDGGR